MEVVCKRCHSQSIVKNGKVRNKQRYKCKACRLNFVVGDRREKVSPEGKALAVLLYSSGMSSYGFIAKLFNVSRTAVLKWIPKEASRLPEPEIGDRIKEMQLDEMWHFINKKNKKYGYREPWIVVEIRPLDRLLGIVLLKPLQGCLTRSNT